ncbi:hypothetical protein BT96DRAFT_987941 [Gymnopus androsaceus JB14]|uniref:F-box domain-containing protein n=1 Tax=Gymnopus androsaceus JB14 TaxID=1447944 RepID=A0A6A4I5G7_9AGAR|nr:hypothetical protein BT96DRAFT_987941 [Gymnopus androsaceus JB14]
MLCEKCKSTIHKAPPSISSEDIHHLLRSGDVLSHEDRMNINAQIRRLYAEIIFLENKKKFSQSLQEGCKSLLAPVRRLPTEILDRIFSLFGARNANRIGDLNAAHLPGLTIMAVCSRWRSVAASCSALWSNINLFGYFNLEQHVAPLKGLRRTRIRTSHRNFGFRGSEMETYHIGYGTVFTASSGRSSFFILSIAFRETSSLLESLYLLNWRDAEVLAKFCNARKLCKLGFRGGLVTQVDVNGGLDVFPRTQIKHLDVQITKSNHRNALNLLALWPNLDSLTYSFDRNMPTLTGIIPPQTSASASSLEVILMGAQGQPNSIGAFLDSSHFPALKHMSIDFHTQNGKQTEQFIRINAEKIAWPEKKFTEFLLRSQCSLTSLEITDAVISDVDLIDLFKHTPLLHRFSFYQHPRQAVPAILVEKIKPATIKLPPLTMVFIESLHAFVLEGGRGLNMYKFGKAILPKLQHLSLMVLSDWFDDDQLFVDVVCSRWIPEGEGIGVDCLKSVELKVWGRILDEKVYEPLAKLDGQGMRVELSSGMPDSESLTI